MPSTDIINTDLIKVFFYGTLKRNEPNSEHLQNRNVTFFAEAVTVNEYPLIVASQLNIPFLLNKKGHGKNVHGEIFLIDNEAKKFFDYFEDIDNGLYSDEQIEVIDKKTNQTHLVHCYMLNNFNENLLNENTVFLESYSSKNDYYPEYSKIEDTKCNLDFVLNSVKAKHN